RYKRTILLSITLFFIGWYGQGQLSIVTVLGVIKTIYNSGTVTFLLYDPFSLIVWFFVLLSLFIWGRGTFCGWLCPYGVIQEFSYYIGRFFKFPTIKVSDKLNSKLVYIKYIILAALILSVFFAPDITKYLVEIEPFKTSITFIFDRQLPYVLYAVFWIFLGMFLFKGFCRYFCPLGAFLSIAGKLRILDWLPRRKECGNPCNNCFKNCNYQAIDKKDGHINYSDCFQCLDCVEIYTDENLCKVLIKDAKNPKKEKKITISKWSTKNV
ncbi:4Fe-4S binding protein, partial [Arcobacteraceae bacterium]|nr:4Fe-4S binding protein [Arcobacteraceae bacterium]